MTPKDRAERSAKALWRDDHASHWLGLSLDAVDEGTARLSMTVERHHCNGHGICHGGITFALADSTFAFACNSYNQRAVAQHNTISYLAPGRLGDTLTATATELASVGRSGLYDVMVTNQDGVQIAAFRGASRTVKGTNFQE